MIRTAVLIPSFLLCLFSFGLPNSFAQGMDWPNWKGPQQNRTSTEKNMIESWDPEGGPGSNLLWKNDELGSRSTPIVLNNRLYTIARDKSSTPIEGSKMVCVDTSNGEIIWEHRFNVYLTDVPDTRVGWSSVVGDPETGRVYALSVSGYFCCLEGETGQVVWERSLHEEFGLLSTYGGRTNVPVVFEDTVLISAIFIGWGDAPKWGFLAKPAHRFLAFDKATGELRWLNGTGISPYDTTYSTPTISVIDGQAMMIFGSGDGEIWALQPRTGKRIWNYPLARRGVNVSPLVVGDKVFASHSEENVVGNTMGALVSLDATQTGDLTDKEDWIQYEIMAGKASPIMVEDKLWVVDDRAKLFIFDPVTGERLAKKALGTVMRSTPLYVDGKVYLCTNNGRWYILKPTESGVKILHKLRLGGEASDGSPIAAHGRIYFPTSAALYCLGKDDVTPVYDPLPEPLVESPVTEDPAPAQIQLIPYDAILRPSESQSYRIRLFNSRGQFLKEVPASEAKFSVEGSGTISGTGIFSASDSSTAHESSLVICEVGDLKGTARVRVVPPLPWSFDFDDAEKVPLTWVGGRVRFVIKDVDGEKVAVKRSVLPTPRDPNNKLGTRSRMWMGQIDLTGYTIQADFALTQSDKTGKMPDLGLINGRYTMTVRSSNKKLRTYSWSPHDYRTYEEVDFIPEPGKWYTMKLRVEPSAENAIVSGKLWPRDEPEPADWTMAMVDESPNRSGSPGIYANAQEAEIYVDNIKVEPNP